MRKNEKQLKKRLIEFTCSIVSFYFFTILIFQYASILSQSFFDLISFFIHFFQNIRFLCVTEKINHFSLNYDERRTPQAHSCTFIFFSLHSAEECDFTLPLNGEEKLINTRTKKE